ncbi:hypothetical protein ACFS5N_05775 [Mucilaginibacter ximonensis]|uniref:Uncharacterized protein n=1 Tax=Mucilaginibacter ximonensis TaxID=538021 RepID=A0ABW5YB03_9SPHI
MEKAVLAELKAIRAALATLAGTSDLPEGEQLNLVALEKAAKEFKKLSTLRKAWVEEYQLSSVFKDVRHGTGKFLREELGFTAYFTHGRGHFYNRKALLALARELKERKVNLARYMEYKTDRAKFEAKVKKAKLAVYVLADDMRNIETSVTPAPSKILVTDEIKRLEGEFDEFREYVDAYEGFAMMKSDYFFSKFRDAAFRARCKKWIESYNYAHEALRLLKDRAGVKA